jgi:hypothetical protein
MNGLVVVGHGADLFRPAFISQIVLGYHPGFWIRDQLGE